MLLGLGKVAFRLFKIFVQFRGTLLGVLNSLLNARHITADFIETRLHFIKGIVKICGLGAQFLD